MGEAASLEPWSYSRTLGARSELNSRGQKGRKEHRGGNKSEVFVVRRKKGKGDELKPQRDQHTRTLKTHSVNFPLALHASLLCVQ